MIKFTTNFSKKTFITSLNFTQTLRRIFQSGYSRIPIYERDRNDVIGILRTKDLIFVNPEVTIHA